MIKGVGIDVIEINRMKELIENYNQHAIEKIFTQKEIQNSIREKLKYNYYAGRFAAKEAAMKAIGKGLSHGISWKDIEILNDNNGKPVLNFYGQALKYAEEIAAHNKEVSISHSKTIAVAIVILY
jgi:holo-[acyl-carrier protein] synthase